MRKRDRSPDSTDATSSSESERDDHVPVLSHAARRKQKEASSNVPSKLPKKEEDTFRQVRGQNSIWVGNLCYKTTPESLRRFFDGVGGITRVHLPTKLGKASPGESARRENRGFAYVDFATPEAKKAAITMTESPLEGRRLLIKDGDSFEGRPLPPDGLGKGHSKFAQKVISAQKQPPAPTLFFGNLAFETTVDSIRGLLVAHRPKMKSEGVSTESAADDDGAKDPWIRKIRMGTFEDSGLCKGFAFVDFTSTEHATAALIHPKNHQLDGRKLVVEYASADAVRRGRGAGPKASTEGHARSKRRDSVVDDGTNAKNCSMAITTTSATTTINSKPPDGRTADQLSGASAKSQVDRRTRKPRPAPGAALALAKREQVAIVPSQGRKITFDDD